MSPRINIVTLLQFTCILFCPVSSDASTYKVNPENYRTFLSQLKAGDEVLFESGLYQDGLPIHGLNGNQQHSIRLIAADRTNPPVFVANEERNTISIVDSSYVTIMNFELDGQKIDVDAVKAEGHSKWAHHITLDGLYIHDHDTSQQNVGISTKCPAWNWVIRNTTIKNTGTGMYLGDSDGSAPFVNGLIEKNIVLDTRGYNLQIKHQLNYKPDISYPKQGSTTIRGNIFSKAKNASLGEDARPNLLVGHWPESGKGSDNYYYIYGNYFYQNQDDFLFQGEGNIAIYNNVLVNTFKGGSGINIRPHNGEVKNIHIFYNTIVAKEDGVNTSGSSRLSKIDITSNLVYANNPITGGHAFLNEIGQMINVSEYLEFSDNQNNLCLLYPKNENLFQGKSLDPLYYKRFPFALNDFNGHKRNGKVYGAFSKVCKQGDWRINLNYSPQIKY